jgi:ribosomal protein S6--L-glutamate ligase
VILAPDTKVAEAVIETLQSTRQNVLIQRFIAESRGRDIRAFVSVTGSSPRCAAAPRATSSGPTSTEAAPPRRRARRGVPAGRGAVGADHGAEGRRRRHARERRRPDGDGGQLLPGLEGIETATELDIAGAIVDYIANQVAFPELDVRQRLTVSTGYGVAELSIRNA